MAQIAEQKKTAVDQCIRNLLDKSQPQVKSFHIRPQLMPMISFALEAERLVNEAKREAAQLHEELGQKRKQIRRVEKTCDRIYEKLAEKEYWAAFQQELNEEKQKSKQLFAMLEDKEKKDAEQSTKQSSSTRDKVRGSSYREYIRKNSMFTYQLDLDKARELGSFFPRRKRSYGH